MDHRGCVCLVGAGPGDPELLTLKAVRLLQGADVVVHDRLVGSEVLALIPPRVRRVCVGKETGRHSLPQEEINALLLRLAREGGTVVRLKGGDPFIFGRGGEEALYLRRHGIPVEIVPGITAATGCAAAAGLPLTHRGLARSVRFVTGHARENRELDLDWDSLADPDCTLVIYMGVGTAPRIAEGLIGAGLSPATPAAVIGNGTLPEQEVWLSELGRLGADVARWQVRPPALLVIGRVAALPGLRALQPPLPAGEPVHA